MKLYKPIYTTLFSLAPLTAASASELTSRDELLEEASPTTISFKVDKAALLTELTVDLNDAHEAIKAEFTETTGKEIALKMGDMDSDLKYVYNKTEVGLRLAALEE